MIECIILCVIVLAWVIPLDTVTVTVATTLISISAKTCKWGGLVRGSDKAILHRSLTTIIDVFYYSEISLIASLQWVWSSGVI